MAHNLSVNHRGHAVFHFPFLFGIGNRLNSDVIYRHFAPMRSLTEPTLVVVDIGEVITVHNNTSFGEIVTESGFARHLNFLLICILLIILLLCIELTAQIFLYLWMQLDVNQLVCVELIYRHLV